MFSLKKKSLGLALFETPPTPPLFLTKFQLFSKIQNGGPSYKPDPKEKGWKNYESYVQQLEEYFFTFYRASWNCRLVVLLTFDGSNKILLSLYFLCNQRGFQLYRSMRFDQIYQKLFPLWKLIYVDFSFTGVGDLIRFLENIFHFENWCMWISSFTGVWYLIGFLKNIFPFEIWCMRNSNVFAHTISLSKNPFCSYILLNNISLCTYIMSRIKVSK